MTRQTTNRIIGLTAAAVHCGKDFCGFYDVIHHVVAQGLGQVLLGERAVGATTRATRQSLFTICIKPLVPTDGVR